MATLNARNFQLYFTYYDLNECNEIIYGLDIKCNGRKFFNPELIHNFYNKEDKFLFSDCYYNDWLMTFFVDVLNTRKGTCRRTDEPPDIGFEMVTWKDGESQREKNSRGKTFKQLNENGDTIDVPYSEFSKLIEPILANNIDFIIELPYEFFNYNEHYGFKLTVKTTFRDLTDFLEEFTKEMKSFYCKFSERISYLGNGKYDVINECDD